MSRENQKLEAAGATGKNDNAVLEKDKTIAHPRNCRTECQYGYNRSMCFPCYAKLMAEHRKAMKTIEKKA